MAVAEDVCLFGWGPEEREVGCCLKAAKNVEKKKGRWEDILGLVWESRGCRFERPVGMLVIWILFGYRGYSSNVGQTGESLKTAVVLVNLRKILP